MFNYNYHTHTRRCGHASGSDEEYVQRAIANGIEYLGFSDHCPYMSVKEGHMRMKWAQLDEYIDTICELKEKYKDQITIKVGLECEYLVDQIETYNYFASKVDYLVLGHHGKSVTRCDYYAGCEDDEIEEYVDSICAGIKSGLFKSVCHPDYFMAGRNSWTTVTAMHCERMVKCAKEYNIPLEINCKGLSSQHKINGEMVYYYPYRALFEIVAKHQTPCVIGIDAHSPEAFDDFAKSCNLISDLLGDLHLNIIENFRI